MIIETDENTNNEDLKHRRKGGAYDDLARILRKINKAQFGTGSIIEDRPGVLSPSQVSDPNTFVKSKSILEIYQQKEAENDNYNLIYIGRKGTGSKRYTNFIELSVNSRSNEGSSGNGIISLSVSKDGVSIPGGVNITNMDNLARKLNIPTMIGKDGIVGIFESRDYGQMSLVYTLVDNDKKPINQYICAVSNTGSEISYLDKDGNSIYSVFVDKDGVSIKGLPTSAPSGSNKLWNSAGTLKIT